MLPCAVRLSKPERQSCSRKQDELSGIRGDRIMRAETGVREATWNAPRNASGALYGVFRNRVDRWTPAM